MQCPGQLGFSAGCWPLDASLFRISQFTICFGYILRRKFLSICKTFSLIRNFITPIPFWCIKDRGKVSAWLGSALSPCLRLAMEKTSLEQPVAFNLLQLTVVFDRILFEILIQHTTFYCSCGDTQNSFISTN